MPLLLIALAAFHTASAQTVVVDAAAAVDYVGSCKKPNGAFGPVDKNYTDLAWTYPAVHTLSLLGEPLPDAAAVFANGSKAWIEIKPWRNGPWYWSLYQKASLYHLYGKRDVFEDDVPFGHAVSVRYKPRASYREFRNYPEGEFFDMASLAHMVQAVSLIGGTIRNADDARDFITVRQAPGGGFTDDVAIIPDPRDDRAHLVSTHHAIMTLNTLGLAVPRPAEVADWIRSCQLSSGGFRWHPEAPDHSNEPDVWYTWAAVRALHALGTEPRDTDACVRWLNSLQNADGGFGDRPGWKSRLYSTYYAVHALEILTGDGHKAITQKARSADAVVIPEGRYAIFQAQHKTPAGGTGMVDSIAAMKLNLVGVKFREPDMASARGVHPSVTYARGYAEHRSYPLEVLSAPENYSFNLQWFNGQPADHIANFLVPPAMTTVQVARYRGVCEAGRKGLPWERFKTQVIVPLRELHPSGNLFYPELDYSMVNAYMVYDDGIDGGPGYNAVPGAHFGNLDWVRHFPYKERWEGVLPLIADGDAHGNMRTWYPNLLQYRNVFLAEDYDFDSYVQASRDHRSVLVILMPDGEVRYYGSRPAVQYLRKHRAEWQWWEDRGQ